MAWHPISNIVPQYYNPDTDQPYSGAVLKAYATGGLTNIAFATDNTGATTVNSVALNADGYPEVSGNIIIPHLDQDYKLALYPDQTAADADSGADWIIDNIVINPQGLATDPPNATDVSTDEFQADLNVALSAGEVFDVDFQSANTTTTPTLENTGGSPSGAKTIKRRDGSELVAGEIEGVHALQWDGTDYLLLDLPLQSATTMRSILSVYSQAEVDEYHPETATDGGTDAYASETTTSTPSTDDIILRYFDSVNTTASPALDTASLVTINGHAWPGMIQNRVHRLLYNGTNYIVLDPNTVVLKAPVDATNGGANDISQVGFSGLGTGVFRIVLFYEDLSLTGTDDLLVQIGDSGGYEVTGYQSGSARHEHGANPNIGQSASGFLNRTGTADRAHQGHNILTLMDDANNTWAGSHNLADSTARTMNGGGFKSLSAELDRVRVASSGTDTFDAGEIGCLVEYRP